VYNTIIQLLVLTGQRRGEVTNAAWREFDFDNAVWTIPKDRTKNRREHRVPISGTALSLLTEWKHSRLSDHHYLFPTRGSDRACFTGFSRSKKRLDQLSGVSCWTVHDLRRTVATKMAESGAQPHVIERILMTPIARVYNRASYEAEMRDALEKWGNHVTSLTSPDFPDR
jgi:integrase